MHGRTMTTTLLAVTLVLIAVAGSGRAQPRAQNAADLDIAMRLADLLRAARSVISAKQPLINSLEPADKGLNGERVLAQALDLYHQRRGERPMAGLADAVDRSLIVAQMRAIREVVDDNQAVINRADIAFKGFVPAVFARLVNERFSTTMDRHARLKVTAPRQFVRNRTALPDAWENEVIDTRLDRPDWPSGQAVVERVESGGRPALRVLVPEYFSPGCLSCHGEPAGSMDITGYPKEGRRLGDLGSVISITLFR